MKLNTILIIILILLLSLNLFFLNNVDANSNEEFKVYTKAECDKNSENIICQDAIFLKCNDVETKLGNMIDANVVLDLDWDDPRN